MSQYSEWRKALAAKDLDRIFVLLLREIYGRGGPSDGLLPRQLKRWQMTGYVPDPHLVRDPEYREFYREYVARWQPRRGLRELLRRGKVPVRYRRAVKELVGGGCGLALEKPERTEPTYVHEESFKASDRAGWRSSAAPWSVVTPTEEG